MSGNWTAAMPDNNLGKQVYINARLLDPASGLDVKGSLITDGETIGDFGENIFPDGFPSEVEIIDCGGKCLSPGFVDFRVQIREPG